MALDDETQQETVDDIEILSSDVSIEDVPVDQDAHLSDEEAIAYKILRRAAMLQGVAIDRNVFLYTELSKKCSPSVVTAAIETTPHKAGIPAEVIDSLADAAISIETTKVAGLSALAGIPGGLAMFGTIPADLLQYFAHSLRIEQKLAYLYGWESFLNDNDQVDDETMTRLIVFLGVMMQVGSASTSITKFASTTARAGISKTIQKQALTKTAWYNPMKQILRAVGVRVTKSSFAEAVAKGVPVLGGVISGGITYATFRPGANRLKNYLRCLPPATGVVLSDAEMEAIEKRIDEESQTEFSKALSSAVDTVGQKAAEAGITREKATEVAEAARDKAGIAAKAAAAGLKRGFGGLSARFAKLEKDGPASSSTEDVAQQLRSFKSLLDDGIITQDDFDAKKKQLLGL